MRDFYVFDIPIYRCTQDAYEKEKEKKIEEHLQRCFENQGIPRASQLDGVFRIRDHVGHSFGGPWNFNQIIGWLRLFAEGMRAGGHIWMACGKRFTARMPKKTFYLSTFSNVLATWLPGQPTSLEIFEHTLEHIEAFANEQYPNRFFDLSVFRRIGPHIDWRSLLTAGIEHNAQSRAQEQ